MAPPSTPGTAPALHAVVEQAPDDEPPENDDEATHDELGDCMPVWVPDRNVTRCQNDACNALFTFTRRRHHCRTCGRALCRNCLGRAPVNYGYRRRGHTGDWHQERVCVTCFPRYKDIGVFYRNLIS